MPDFAGRAVMALVDVAVDRDHAADARPQREADDRGCAPAGTETQLRETERAQVEQMIQQRLGGERYAEFKRGEDEDYHRLNALAARHKLPKEKVVEAYGYKKIVNDYRAQVQADPNLNAQQKSAAARAIGDETEKALRVLLGEKAFRHYVRTGQGGWIRE